MSNTETSLNPHQSVMVRAEHDYEILVGADWRKYFSDLRGNHAKVLIIAPQFIVDTAEFKSYADNPQVVLFITPDAEAQKSADTLQAIWKVLGDNGFGRTDAIVAIGGGATTDLGGFAAATWMRGISWYAVPTTLAGMVDASIGGKTGINTETGKNLVGAFYSPRSVCIDLSWLTTLSDRDYAAGLAEVIKTGCIRDLEILNLLDRCQTLSEAREVSGELILRSATVKADVVSNDFKEGKLREILNFGHTLGHAIEKLADYQLRHGEAVSMGMAFALQLSAVECGLSDGERVTTLLKKFGLPTTLDANKYPWEALHAAMVGDKKSRDGRVRFIGLTALGEPTWIESAGEDVLVASYERICQ